MNHRPFGCYLSFDSDFLSFFHLPRSASARRSVGEAPAAAEAKKASFALRLRDIFIGCGKGVNTGYCGESVEWGRV